MKLSADRKFRVRVTINREICMKRIAFTLALIVLFAFTAHAQVKEFTSVTVDVPDGWTSAEQGPMVMLMSADQQSVITLAVAPAGEQSAELIARKTSEALKGTAPVAEGDGWYFTFTAEGQDGAMLIRVVDKQAIVATLMGKDKELLPTAKSIALKK